VAHLLLQDPDFPRSVAFCLERVADSLRNLFGERVRGDTPLHYCSHLRSELLFADIASYFPEDAGARVKPRAFCDWLQSVIERLERLSVTVADHYLSHQAAAPALAAGEED
jgi:uncharacterized alpha-E superfamily protein